MAVKCPKCQFENREGAEFCRKCGNRMEIACPKCNWGNLPGSNFCDKCGSPLLEA